MIMGAIGVFLILVMAVLNSGNVSNESSNLLQDFYKENPYEQKDSSC